MSQDDMASISELHLRTIRRQEDKAQPEKWYCLVAERAAMQYLATLQQLWAANGTVRPSETDAERTLVTAHSIIEGFSTRTE